MNERELIHAALANLTAPQLRDLQATVTRFKRLPFTRLMEISLAQEACRTGEISRQELWEQEEQALAECQSREESRFVQFLETELSRRLKASRDMTTRQGSY